MSVADEFCMKAAAKPEEGDADVTANALTEAHAAPAPAATLPTLLTMPKALVEVPGGKKAASLSIAFLAPQATTPQVLAFEQHGGSSSGGFGFTCGAAADVVKPAGGWGCIGGKRAKNEQVVVVTAVQRGGWAEKQGVRRGWRVQAVGGIEATSLEQVQRQLKGCPASTADTAPKSCSSGMAG